MKNSNTPRFIITGLLFIISSLAINATATLTDVLDYKLLKSATSTTITEFTSDEMLSGAVYKGTLAIHHSYFGSPFYMGADSPQGFVTIQSKGKVKKITVHWSGSTGEGAADATLTFYGKTTAYTAYSDLSGDDKGTLIETFEYDPSTLTQSYAISDEVNYIGFTNGGSAKSLVKSVVIEWEPTAEVLKFSSDELVVKISDTSFTTPSLISSYTGKTATYASSDEEIATVDNDGDVTLLSVGKTKITATIDDVSTSYDLTVLPEMGYAYYQVTSQDELIDNGSYLIARIDATYKRLLGMQNNEDNRRMGYESANQIETDYLSIANVDLMTAKDEEKKAAELVLQKVVNNGKDYWVFRDDIAGGWLKKNGTKNEILTDSMRRGTCISTITIEDDGYATINFCADNVNRFLRYNISTMYFTCYQSSTTAYDVKLYRRLDPKTFTLNSEGYATFYSDYPYIMPKGVNGAVITNADNGILTADYRYTEGKTVPAKTALLLKGTPGKEYTYCFVASSKVSPTDNLLHGADAVDSDGKTFVSGTNVKYYILSHNKDGKNLSFYWAASDGGSITYKSGYAFLAIDFGAGAKVYSNLVIGDDETTAIQDAAASIYPADDKIYTLTGQYVGTNAVRLPKGVYIQNGKTFVK